MKYISLLSLFFLFVACEKRGFWKLNRIDDLTPTRIELFAGKPGNRACTDCFNFPSGLDVDKDGNVFVANQHDHTIVQVSTDKVFNIIAGKKNELGFCIAGSGLNARFYYPSDIAIHPNRRELYVSDHSSGIIRRIDNNTNYAVYATPVVGKCTTLVCPTSAIDANQSTFNRPDGIVIASNGDLLFTAKHCSTFFREASNFVTIETTAGTLSTGPNARKGLDLNKTQLFIADSGNKRILTQENDITKPLWDTQLESPVDVAFNGRNTLFIVDETLNQIFSLNLERKIFTLIAGNGKQDYQEGGGDPLNASFKNPQGLAYDRENDILYIADTGNHVIRRIFFE